MHELSIAAALCELVRPHAPAAGRIVAVGVFCGARRGIDPDALQMAWRATTTGTALANAALHLELEPWQMTCRSCGRQWTGVSPVEECTCRSLDCDVTGTDELTLRWIETDEPEAGSGSATQHSVNKQGEPCESRSH
ncbi:MAG: hydrogenase maturation nickel metallochaperone HypA [Phycisphaerae bacterium]